MKVDYAALFLLNLLIIILSPVAYSGEKALLDENVARDVNTIAATSAASKCEPITNRFCQYLGQGYSKTIMPNVFGHDHQMEAEKSMQVYSPLLKSNCSKYLRFFLCSIYSPFCWEPAVGAIHSCRNLCQQVYEDCSNAIQQLAIPWLEQFNCSNFPEFRKNSLCMQFPKLPAVLSSGNGDSSGSGDSSAASSMSSSSFVSPLEKLAFSSSSASELLFHKRKSSTAAAAAGGNSSCPPDRVAVWEESTRLSCQARCDRDVNYSENDKKLLERWMIAWAILCFISTLFTLMTFAINRARFNYPERPIIFFVICYSAISLLYIGRYVFGAETFVCRSSATESDPSSYVVADGLDQPVCTVSFLLYYYLTLSANVWWFILSLCWFLSAAKKWSAEAISDFSSYFHCVAWAVPGFLAVLTLSLHSVSGYELTGLCRISDNSLVFSIIPNTVMLTFTCLVCTFTGTALSHVKYELNQSGRNVFKLEKLTTRLVIFQLFYIIPSVISIISSVYEGYFQQRPNAYQLFDDYRTRIISNSAAVDGHHTPDDSGNSDVQMALVKIFSELFVGIMSGMWVWTQKTCHIWLHFVVPSNKKTDIFLSG